MDLVLKVLCVVGSSFVLTRAAALRQPRLTLMEAVPSYYLTNVDGNPGTYSFGYDVADPATGNNQYRTEERLPNGTVVGSYGYVDPRGKPYRFRYVADERGYRVSRVKQRIPYYQPPKSKGTTEPSVTWTRPKKKPNNKDIHAKDKNKMPSPMNYFNSQKSPTIYKLY